MCLRERVCVCLCIFVSVCACVSVFVSVCVCVKLCGWMYVSVFCVQMVAPCAYSPQRLISLIITHMRLITDTCSPGSHSITVNFWRTPVGVFTCENQFYPPLRNTWFHVYSAFDIGREVGAAQVDWKSIDPEIYFFVYILNQETKPLTILSSPKPSFPQLGFHSRLQRFETGDGRSRGEGEAWWSPQPAASSVDNGFRIPVGMWTCRFLSAGSPIGSQPSPFPEIIVWCVLYICECVYVCSRISLNSILFPKSLS